MNYKKFPSVDGEWVKILIPRDVSKRLDSYVLFHGMKGALLRYAVEYFVDKLDKGEVENPFSPYGAGYPQRERHEEAGNPEEGA